MEQHSPRNSGVEHPREDIATRTGESNHVNFMFFHKFIERFFHSFILLNQLIPNLQVRI